MRVARTLVQWLLALALTAALVYAVWWLLAQLGAWVTAQPSQVAAATIAFAGTVIAGIGAVLISQQRTKAREIAESHRPKKTELYTGFITQAVVGTMREGTKENGPDPEWSKTLEDFFYDFTTQVMLWGSPGVLRAYGAFRRIGETQDPNVLLMVDDILQAMRRDLGLSNRALSRGDLVKLLLTDPESLDAFVKEQPGK